MACGCECFRNRRCTSLPRFLAHVQVLEDVVEYEITAEGTRETHLEQILLNGNNIALLVGRLTLVASTWAKPMRTPRIHPLQLWCKRIPVQFMM